MNKPTHNIIHKLLISTGVLLITFHTSITFAKSKFDSEFDLYIQKIEHMQKIQSNNKLPKGGFICNGKIVIAPKVMKKSMSCTENTFSNALISS